MDQLLRDLNGHIASRLQDFMFLGDVFGYNTAALRPARKSAGDAGDWTTNKDKNNILIFMVFAVMTAY